MKEAPMPADEELRLAELHSYGLLDMPGDEAFDAITRLVRDVCGVPIAILSLVDRQRQWFQSCIGLDGDLQETVRDISFCAQTLLQRHPLIVSDALADDRFRENPLVKGEPFIRFFAGFPLIASNGFCLGSLCAIDRECRTLSECQYSVMALLAAHVVRLMEPKQDSSEPHSAQDALASRGHFSYPRRDSSLFSNLLSRDQVVHILDLIFDLDVSPSFSILRCQFKNYARFSATLGAPVAEEMIAEAVRRITNTIPSDSSIARFSDDEILVFIPLMADRDVIASYAGRLVDLMDEPCRIGSHFLPLDVAIGICSYRENYTNSESLLADASMACRLAGRGHHSAYRFIDNATRQSIKEQYDLEVRIRHGLRESLPMPFFQPIVDLISVEPVGFEVLARWPSQEGQSPLYPDQFLGVAKTIGMVGILDLQIIEKAIAAAHQLAAEVPWRPMVLSVNLSGQLIEDPLLRDRLMELIRFHPMPMGWQLQVELVEDCLQEGEGGIDEFLRELVAREVCIAIDDFGTGYSSLSRLDNLPIRGLKIDRSFVGRIDDAESPSNQLLKVMVLLGVDLGLSATAEGIEEDSQRRWLIEHGCRKGQGYLFSRPMPLAEASAYLQGLSLVPPPIQPSAEGHQPALTPKGPVSKRRPGRLRRTLGAAVAAWRSS